MKPTTKISAPKGPPWWRPFARRRWRRALELMADRARVSRQLATAVRKVTGQIGLAIAGDACGAELVLPDRRRIQRRTADRRVDANENAIASAAGEMLRAIRHERGPGQVWTLPGLELVFPQYDDGMLVHLDERNRPFVQLNAVYWHEADAITPPPPPPRQCLGPEGDGCPFDALALPEHHHCERCLPIYTARYRP